MLSTQKTTRYTASAFIVCLLATSMLHADESSRTLGNESRARRFLRRLSFQPEPSSRSHPSVKVAFRDVVRQTKNSTVRVLGDGAQIALGAVVRSDGYILTKGSELTGKIECLLSDNRKLEAEVVGLHPKHDLAMLKVNAKRLPTVVWSSATTPPVGAWLATADLTADPKAIGVVSAVSRQISPPQAVLGIQLESTGSGARVAFVVPDSGASQANIRLGDVVLRINANAVTTPDDVTTAIRRFQPGDQIMLAIRRGGQSLRVSAKLGAMANLGNNTQAEIMDSLGGPLSERRAGFPSVLQHDTVLRPRDCGGPVVGLDGKVAGINIARASRVASYAVPTEVVKPLVADLINGRYAPVAQHGGLSAHRSNSP